MPSRDVWFWPKTARLYGAAIKSAHRGQDDEVIVKKSLAAQGFASVVSLGVGDGREFAWLKGLKSVKKIIGVDYSAAMLAQCRENAAKSGIRIDLICDDLFDLQNLEEIITKEKSSVAYLCLLNTLGNFTREKRVRIVLNVRRLMKKGDRLALCLYKKPGSLKRPVLPGQLVLKNGVDGRRIGLALEYARNEVLWSATYERFGCLPRFDYDKAANDVAAYSGQKKVFFSNRFSSQEIKGMCRFTGLEVERLIEGKYMWTAILK
ncbi:MAG: class I SAM-dependent methyltransferase [Candidatus Pacebacteria bacterium]|jgi:SAM-dependent methyltransferase|nr:class I SAM-dependent methyltransferase [Candidatus Paceibacterota bacterium]